MHFKNPDILYFLFLLIIPILVHLFQLRRFKKEYFTNVKFLKELSIQTRKSSKIKKYLLLATRLLLLAFFIIAFAQPYFKGKDSQNNSNELFVVLDNSYSMQAKGKNGPLLNSSITDLIKFLPEGKQFTLLTNDQDFYNVDIKSVQNELLNLGQSGTAFDLKSAFAKINNRKSAFGKDVIIITDGLGINTSVLSQKNPEMNLQFVVNSAQQKNNTAIDSIYIQPISDEFIEIVAVIKSFGKITENLPIALYNGEQLIAKTVEKITVPNQLVKFTVPNSEFNGYLNIEDQSISYDNDFYFTINKPKKIKVLSIGDKEKSEFLSKIYVEKEFTYQNSELKSLDFNQIQNQDVIILNELSEISESLQITLNSFVEKNGNIIIIPAKDAKIESYNRFLNHFGDTKYTQKISSEQLITKISIKHPLFSNVFEKQIDNFQYPNILTGWEIASSSPSVLTLASNQSFVTAIQKGDKYVYAFGGSINTENSNFQKSPLIVPTFYNMAQKLNQQDLKNFWIGQNSTALFDIKLTENEIISIKNISLKNDNGFIPQQQIKNNQIALTFSENPTKSGSFQLISKNEIVGNIAFNYLRTESDLTSYDSKIFENESISNNLEQAIQNIQSDRENSELWKIFLLLTLLLIAIEILIQKFVK